MSMPNLSQWKCRIRPPTNNETKGEHFTVAIYSTLTFWRFLDQIYRSTLQLRALKPEYPMELSGCREWAVQLGISKVKLRNNEKQLFRREITYVKSSTFGRKKTHHKDVKCCKNILLNVCNLPWKSIKAHFVHTAFKENEFCHEHHLAYPWEILAILISINKRNE